MAQSKDTSGSGAYIELEPFEYRGAPFGKGAVVRDTEGSKVDTRPPSTALVLLIRLSVDLLLAVSSCGSRRRGLSSPTPLPLLSLSLAGFDGVSS